MRGLVLANVILVLSASVGVLALLDLLLSEQQKSGIADYTLRFWALLADLKKLRFADFFRNLFVRIGLALLATGVILTGLFFASPILVPLLMVFSMTMGEALNIAILFLSLLLITIIVIIGAVWLGQKVIFLVLRPAHELYVAVRAVVTGAILIFLSAAFVENLDRLPEGSLFLPVLLFLFYVSLASVMLLVYWGSAVLPLLFAYAATVALFVLELVVRRIAEYPKGPILALSAACGGIAAALKFVG